MHLRRVLIVSVCLSAFAVTAARACPDHAAKASAQLKPGTASAAALVAWKPRAWTPPASAAAGLRVAIDPVDGTLSMPAPDELSASAGMSDEELRPVSLIRRANGATRAQLDERWESHAVASIGPDGKLRWTCVDGKKSADRFLRNPVVPAPAPVSAAPVWEEK